MKTCGKCKQDKPLADFYQRSNRSSVNSECKECSKKRSRDSELKRKSLLGQELWSLDRRDKYLTRTYGMNVTTYDYILKTQGGVCAICFEPPSPDKPLCVDHDHSCCPGKKSCGKCVRGLLCDACNTSVGLMNDSPKRLRRAAYYVESWEDINGKH